MKPTEDQINWLVAKFQRERMLSVNGFGPKTSAEMERCMFIPGAISAIEKDGKCTRLIADAFRLAIEDVGLGGDPGNNNSSAYIALMRDVCGFPPAIGPWCGVFASCKLLLSSGNDAEIRALLSRGARKLVRQTAAKGTDITALVTGSNDDFLGLGAWERPGDDWQAHVRFLGRWRGRFFYAAGNEARDLAHWDFMSRDLALHGLIQVATI